MTARLFPLNIQLIGRELAIAWNDATETYFEQELLRRSCPCAACGGEPDVLGYVVRPEGQYTESSFELVRWQMVGGYAWQPTWGDGHGSGLYAFDFLRKLAAAQP